MTNFYVDGTRPDDTGDGLSEGAAKKTVSAGIALASTSGDVVNIKSSATYTITASLVPAVAGMILRGYSSTIGDDGTKPTITCATNSVNLVNVGANGILFDNLTMTHTAGTRGWGFYPATADRRGIVFRNCVIDGCLVGIQGEYNTFFTFTSLIVDNTEIKNCVSHGIWNADTIIQNGSYIHDNGGDGWKRGLFTAGSLVVLDSTIAANATNSINWSQDTGGFLLVRNSNLIGKGGSSNGISLTNSAASITVSLSNNIIELHGAYGMTAAAAPTALIQRNNAFRSNTSGDRNATYFASSASDITLTGDPFTNAAGGDYSLNNTAGAGAACRSAGFPGVTVSGTGYADIGAFRHQDAGGGTTTVINTPSDWIIGQ